MFETKEQLEEWLESEESEEWRDNNFYTMLEISEDKITDCPYWIDSYYNQPEDYQVQYRAGYYEPRKVGDILVIDGLRYEYIDSQLLPEEIEHQANDGGLCYEYRGPSFLRILKRLD